jgi:glutamate carboxypeptidase
MSKRKATMMQGYSGWPVAVFATAAVVIAVTVEEPRAQARLSADEQAIVRHVDEGFDAAVGLLERVVNINSGTQNTPGVREVADVFRAEFDLLGFDTEWVDGAGWQRAGHLVARRPGPGPRMLLIGHLDTVFEPDSPFQRFERLDANTARGPGIIDMKGGDVIIVLALQALQSAGVLDSMNLTVVMTGDEEAPGRPLSRAREALVAEARGAAIAMGFEDGDGDPAHAVIARRGTTSWQVTVRGTPAHSSQVFTDGVGAGAIFEAARILEGFRTRMAGEQFLTFNPGVVLGGTALDFDPSQARGSAFGKTNVIAEQTLVSGDLRALTAEQFARARATMRAVVADSLPHTSAEITFDEGYPPLAPTDGNRRLLALFDQASRDLGLGAVEPVSPDKAGAADVSFVAGDVSMIMDAAGLKGRDGHTVGETADLRTLAIQAKRAAVTLARIARDGVQADDGRRLPQVP